MKWNITFICVMLMAYVQAQTFSDRISKQLSFEKKSPANTLIVSNINGNINLVGYEGSEILVEAEKTITGKTQARLDKGKSEVEVKVIDSADTIVVYVKDGCNGFSMNPQGDRSHRNGNRWGYNWNCSNNCDIDYDYKVNITIKVPLNVNVIASTINEGDVDIKGMSASVKANNINGSIKLDNLRTETQASTINGDVDVVFTPLTGISTLYFRKDSLRK
jgi:hypothetical protein